MKATFTAAALAVWLVLGALPASGVPLFDQSLTGAQLAADPGVSFPTDTPSVSGNALDIINTADAQVLLRWNLLPAAPRGALHIRTTVDYDRITTQTADNDPLFGIAGDDLFLGVSRQNNGGGQVGSIRSTLTATTSSVSSGPLLLTAIDPLDPFTFDLRTDLLAITRYEEGSDVATGTFAPPGGAFDASGPIDFVLASGGVSVGEGFRINSVSVTITAVPEPGTRALLGIGLAALAVGRRRAS